jgi:hypothetical protein
MIKFFYYFKLIFFSVFRLFLCADIKIIFLKIKNIILIYFSKIYFNKQLLIGHMSMT